MKPIPLVSSQHAKAFEARSRSTRDRVPFLLQEKLQTPQLVPFPTRNVFSPAQTNTRLRCQLTFNFAAKTPRLQITAAQPSSNSILFGGRAKEMEPLEEDVEYSWKEVVLPSLIPLVLEPELERETGERRRGRDLLVAVDHGPNSKHAFNWALVHLCRLADTLHLVHAVSSVHNDLVYESSRELMEKLAVEAFQVALVKTKTRIVEGDAGKAICREAERLKPAAVVMGTRGRSILQSVLQGSISEYCFHNCKVAPVIIVPGKDVGEKSVI